MKMSLIQETERVLPAPPKAPPASQPAAVKSPTTAGTTKRPNVAVVMQPPAIAGDTFRGHLYTAKCRYAERKNMQWQPKEPQDQLWRIFCELVTAIHNKASVQKTKRILAIFASKGGSGKTPTAANLAAILKVASKASALLGDLNHNTGTTGDRTGVNRTGEDTKLLFDIFADPNLIIDHDTAADHFPKHGETGLDVLMSNTGKSDTQVDVKLVIDIIFMLKAAYYSVVLDTGNGNDHPINEGSMFATDVAGFTVMADQLDQIMPSIITMIEFASLGHQAKVFAAPKIICATFKGDTVQKFFELFKEKAWEHLEGNSWSYTSPWGDPVPDKAEDQSEEEWHMQLVSQLLEDHGITEAKIFLVPYSEYIHRNGVVSLMRRATGMPALIAYARIVLYMLEVEVPSIKDKKRHIEKILEERVEDKKALAEQKAIEAEQAALRSDLERVLQEAKEKGTGEALGNLLVKYAADIQKANGA
jgi:hypothetical protein